MVSPIPAGYELEESEIPEGYELEVSPIPAGYELERPDPYQVALDDSSLGEQIKIGAGETVTELGQGINDFLNIGGGGSYRQQGQPYQPNAGDLSNDQSREDLRRSRATSSPAKTGGKIAADIAALAVPTSKIVRGGQGLARALAAESALVGSYEGTKLPGEGESRGSNAAQAAAITAATGGALPVVAKTARAVIGSPKAGSVTKAMLDEGVPMLPSEAIPDNKLLGQAERLMEYLPTTGRRIDRRKLEQVLFDQEMTLKNVLNNQPANPTPEFVEELYKLRKSIDEIKGQLGWSATETVKDVALDAAAAVALGPKGVLAVPLARAATSRTAADLMTGRQGAGGLTNTIRAMYGDTVSPVVGGAAGVLSSPVTPRDLYDEKDPNDRMRLLANELRGRRF